MTVSKDLAMRMKEKGFPQESEKYFLKLKWKKEYELYIKIKETYIACDGSGEVHINSTSEKVSAPTVTEILAELPKKISRNLRNYRLSADFLMDTVSISYKNFNMDHMYPNVADTLEEALGKMYLLLKKENII